MSADQSGVKIYSELSCILDDRMGILNNMDLEQAEKVFHNGYHTRTSDEFEGFSMIEYRRRWLDRDMDVIRMSPMTNIFAHFMQLNERVVFDAVQGPFRQRIEYVVNTWPYQFDVDTEDAVRAMIWHYLGKFCSVTMVHLKPERVTVGYLKSYDAIYMYNIWEWVEMHDREFDLAPSTRLHDVVTYTPRLYTVRKPNIIEEEQMNDKEDVFTSLEKAISPLLGLNHVDVKTFSTPVPPYHYKKKPT